MKLVRLRGAALRASARSVALTVGVSLAVAVGTPQTARAEAQVDRTVAVALVSQLERDPAHASLVADALAHARAALERGTRLRAAADEPHARQAEGVAREWAEMARDLASAVSEESRAASERLRAREAERQLELTKALVEEAIARLGRLRAATARSEPGRDPHTAVEVHDAEPQGHHAPKAAPGARGAVVGSPREHRGQEGSP
jgi:hypothetical protein